MKLFFLYYKNEVGSPRDIERLLVLLRHTDLGNAWPYLNPYKTLKTGISGDSCSHSHTYTFQILSKFSQ